MTIAYLGLGSNLGDREMHLRQAVHRLESADIRILRRSSIYETEPQDVGDQPWFLNMVVEIETSLSPQLLLERTQAIERDLGRERVTLKGPRTIDLDILLYGDELIDTPELQIPHPRLTSRRFVLEPFAELAPTFKVVRAGLTVRQMLDAIDGQLVRRWN